jgi:hypothetical protein
MGTRAGLSWGAGGVPNGVARDLRPDDSLGPIFTSDPLSEDLEVLGSPAVVLSWESPVPVATAVVRLHDVAPDGTPFQVSAGILNLTHRDSHENPEPLVAGEVATVRIALRATAHRFLAGHRIRLSVASAMWPVVWPSPFPAEYGLHLGGSHPARVVLPSIPADRPRAGVPALKATPAGLREIGGYEGESPVWQVVDDVIAGTVTVRTSEFGESTLPDGHSTLYTGERLEMTARDADPAEARMDNEVVYRLREDDREILVEADGMTRTTATEIEMRVGLRVRLDGEPFFEREWRETVERDLL